MDFSRNGKVAITGSDDNTARLWDAAKGGPLGAPLRHQSQVLDVQLNSEGTMALTGSDDKTARLWAVPSGEPLGDPLYHGDEGRSMVLTVAFRPDGRAILTGCGRFARLWTLGALTYPKPTEQAGKEQSLNRPAHVAYSPDVKLMLLIVESEAKVLDADTRQAVGIPLPTKYPVLSVAWSPDGAMLLTGGSDGTAQVWSAPLRCRSASPWSTKVRFIPCDSVLTAARLSPAAPMVWLDSGTRPRGSPSARAWSTKRRSKPWTSVLRGTSFKPSTRTASFAGSGHLIPPARTSDSSCGPRSLPALNLALGHHRGPAAVGLAATARSLRAIGGPPALGKDAETDDQSIRR